MGANNREVLLATARFALIQAMVDFEEKCGSLTAVEWLWILQQEQTALIVKLEKHQKPEEPEKPRGEK